MNRCATATLVALVIVLIQGAGVAAAEPPAPWRSVSDPRVTVDLQVAQAFWGRTPDCSNYQVWEADLSYINAWGMATIGGCVMWISPTLLVPIPTGRDVGYLGNGRFYWSVYLCLAIVHEYGHSLGHLHVDDPTNIMYHGLLPVAAVPACTSIQPHMEAIARPGQPEGLFRWPARIRRARLLKL